MKLFISYRRKDWPFTRGLVEGLRRLLQAQIFVDIDSIHEDDFLRALMNELATSDAVLLIVSPNTFAPDRINDPNDWVRREIGRALELNKPLIMAGIDGLMPPEATKLPDDIRAIANKQVIEFYPRFFDPAVLELAKFIAKATPIPLRSTVQRRWAARGLVMVVVLLIGIGAAALALENRLTLSQPTAIVQQLAGPTQTTIIQTLNVGVSLSATASSTVALPTDTATPLQIRTSTPTPVTIVFTPTLLPTQTATTVPTLAPTDTPIILTNTAIPSNPNSFTSNLDGWRQTVAEGTWQQQNGSLVAVAPPGTDTFFLADGNRTDFTYEASFTIQTGSEYAAAGIIFRSQENPRDGCYLLRVSIFNGGEVALTRFFPVRKYKQIQRINLPIVLNQRYNLKVMVVGTQMTVSLNGQYLFDVSDAGFASGAVGLNVNASTVTFHSASIGAA